MKRLLIAAMLLGSASAFAQPPQNPPANPQDQPQGQPDQSSQPTQQPDAAPAPPADPMPPEGSQDTMQPVSPAPADPMMAQPQAAPPAAAPVERQQYSYGTIPPPRPADETYQRCSRTVTDNCVQGGPR